MSQFKHAIRTESPEQAYRIAQLLKARGESIDPDNIKTQAGSYDGKRYMYYSSRAGRWSMFAATSALHKDWSHKILSPHAPEVIEFLLEVKPERPLACPMYIAGFKPKIDWDNTKVRIGCTSWSFGDLYIIAGRMEATHSSIIQNMPHYDIETTVTIGANGQVTHTELKKLIAFIDEHRDK